LPDMTGRDACPTSPRVRGGSFDLLDTKTQKDPQRGFGRSSALATQFFPQRYAGVAGFSLRYGSAS